MNRRASCVALGESKQDNGRNASRGRAAAHSTFRTRFRFARPTLFPRRSGPEVRRDCRRQLLRLGGYGPPHCARGSGRPRLQLPAGGLLLRHRPRRPRRRDPGSRALPHAPLRLAATGRAARGVRAHASAGRCGRVGAAQRVPLARAGAGAALPQATPGTGLSRRRSLESP